MPATVNAEQISLHNRNFGYAGDITAIEAWQLLQAHPQAVLVDVRTPQEWEQVGLPNLSSINKQPIKLTWKMLPNGQGAEQFAGDFAAFSIPTDSPVLLLCRGGARSQAAAIALTAKGHVCCLNIAGGFEGQNGWKAEQLPS